jgi:methylglutaconyl-CoA hydratase
VTAVADEPTYRHLRVRRDGAVEHAVLDRPAVRNAFNPALVDDLYAWARSLDDRPDVRAAVLSGAGPVFCAGGDLAEMASLVHASRDGNLAEAQRMAAMFDALDRLAVPLVGRVHGAALGGGVGLASVCDIVVAAEDAMFGFTEVKLGIVPSVISPYALARIGRTAARELFLTGARFGAARARAIGLVNEVVPAAELDRAIGVYLAEILSAAPEALRTAKRLIREVWGRPPADAAELTVAALADRRVSAEGQEGLRAFLEKRRPSWVTE